MKRKKEKFLTFSIILTIISFILHLGWEYAQCSPFFIHGEVSPTSLSMLRASLGDVVLTWIAYLIVSAFSKSLSWGLKCWGFRNGLLLSFIAIILSIGIEIYAINYGRWSYSKINPLIFDKVSLIPILQLLIIFPLSIKISKCLLYHFSSLQVKN